MATRAPINSGTFEESAEDLYEHAPCGYISTRPGGDIVRANHTFLDWTGYELEELLGVTRFQDLLTVGGKIFHETHYAPLLRMQGFVTEISFELVCKNGRQLPVLINSVLKKDSTGKPVLHRTTLFNITDRKNYERELRLARKKAEQAEQAAKAKMDLLSMVSHEIRTPMNAIVGLASLLSQTELSAEQLKYVSLLQSSSGNLLGLLNHILDFSKIEAGKVVLEERRFHVLQLLEGILHGLSLKAEQKRLAVRVELDERLPAWCLGDPVKLSQILTNLLANAIKFTEAGSVTLAAKLGERQGDTVGVDFTVTDTGIGIPEERQAAIFEEFAQASYDISLKYGGTGLGLAICQKLLALYGSKLGVRSQPGQGSAFFFRMSLKVAPDAEAPPPMQRVAASQSLRGLRLLVAEDNAVNVFVLSQLLRKWGVSFEVVENGHQAVAKVQQEPYDAVLMDLQMPQLDGYDATRAIRGLPGERFQQLPILAMTASARLGLEERLAAAGFTDFVCKPFTPEELLAKLSLRATPSFTLPGRPRRFHMEEFTRLAEGDPGALAEFCDIAISSAQQHKLDFQHALETPNLEQFDFQAHKIKMTLELLHAEGLRSAIQQGRALLTAQETEPTRLRAAVFALHAELDAIIAALKLCMPASPGSPVVEAEGLRG